MNNDINTRAAEPAFKFLDADGVAYLWSKITLEDYPNNDVLAAVLDAIDETKADKDEVAQALEDAKDYADAGLLGKADKIHSHDDLYYTEGEVDSLFEIYDTLKQDRNLIVTFADSAKKTSSHSSTEIYNAINSGTTVYFNNGATNFAYLEGNANIVTFYNCFYNNDRMLADVYEIRGTAVGNVHYQTNIVKQEDINNAVAALKDQLLNGAGEAYDTLKELGELIDDNRDAIEALEVIAGVQSDWNQSNESAKDFIKNRTHWVEDQSIAELVCEETLDNSGQWFLDFVDPDLNATYRITLNGAVYTESIYELDSYREFGKTYYTYGIGNSDLGSYPATDYISHAPFLIEIQSVAGTQDGDASYSWYAHLDNSINTPVDFKLEKVTGSGEVIHQLDEKFIPDTIARMSDLENIDLSNYETKTDAAAKLTSAQEYANEKYDAAIAHADAINAQLPNRFAAKDHNHDNKYDAIGAAATALADAQTYADGLISQGGFVKAVDLNNAINTVDNKIDGVADTLSQHSSNETVHITTTDRTNIQTALDQAETANQGVADLTAIVNTKVGSSEVNAAVTGHNASSEAHSDIRASLAATDGTLTELKTKVEKFLNVSDTTTDELSEVLNLIAANRGDLDSILGNYVEISKVVDNLTTNDASKVLSAKQGKALKDLYDALNSVVTAHTGNSTVHITAAERTKWNDVTNKASKDELEALSNTVDTKANKSTTINGYALSSNISLSASDVDAYSRDEIDNLVLITEAEIDEICGMASLGPSFLLVDFNYNEGEGEEETYILTEWKGTTDGVTGTECIIPDDPRIIL